MKHTSLTILLLLLTLISPASWAGKDGAAKEEAKVLIIGLNDNVKSNYYYNEQIASETGMKADSIDQQYNNIIAGNIAGASIGSPCKFIPGGDDPMYEQLIGKIEVSGEGEDANSSLSHISTEELQQALDHAHADYLLVLNQHYLKWQEQPMRTVFHMVSYTLYNKERKQIYTGNQYFTTMSLEAPEKIIQLSRKSSSKIASSVARSLDR
jgi:hypothetical protein